MFQCQIRDQWFEKLVAGACEDCGEWEEEGTSHGDSCGCYDCGPQ